MFSLVGVASIKAPRESFRAHQIYNLESTTRLPSYLREGGRDYAAGSTSGQLGLLSPFNRNIQDIVTRPDARSRVPNSLALAKID